MDLAADFKTSLNVIKMFSESREEITVLCPGRMWRRSGVIITTGCTALNAILIQGSVAGIAL